MIGHRECEAGDAHISTLQLLVSVKPAIESAVALGREDTAVRIAILRGLVSNPPETSCLWCLVAASLSPCEYPLHGSWEREISRCCLDVYVLALATLIQSTVLSLFTSRVKQKG